MKTCPSCNNQFSDELINCPNDGALLSASNTIPTPEINSKKDDPLIGKLIAKRFQILSKLGEGGMGSVYRAEHTKMNRLCAIKILNAAIANDKDAAARFNREAQMSSKLDHPHAIAIYDFGEAEEGLIYLAMEIVEGEMLSTILKQEGHLSIERTLYLAHQIGAALDAAHKLNIIHRDLKPDNIMIAKKDNKDWVKVLDFGIAKIATEDQRQDLTQAGMVIGTPLYMSPEQLAGEKLDARSDIYSFSLIIYQMLTGALPFKGENTQAVMVKRLTEAPLPLKITNPNINVPPDLESAILQGLARDKNNRPRTASALLTALESGASQTGNIQSSPNLAATVMQNPIPGTNQFPPAASYQTTGRPNVSTSQPAANIPTRPLQPTAPPTPQMATIAAPMHQAHVPPTRYNPPAMSPPAFQQMPTTTSKKSSKLGLIVGIVVAVVILGIGGLIALGVLTSKTQVDVSVDSDKTNKKKKTEDSTDSTNKTDSTNIAEAQTAYDDGVTLMNNKQYKEAEEKFREAVQIKSDFWDAHLNLGTALFNNYKLPQAVEEYKVAARYCESAEKKFKAYYGRGLSNWEMKKYDLAVDDFSEAYKYKPDNHELIAFRGFVLQLSGRQSEANTSYDSYLALNNSGNVADMVKACRAGQAVPPATLKEGGFNPEF